MDRPQLQEMLKYIREGDTVYVSEFARLGRSTIDLLQLVQQIQDSGAHLISLKESLDTSTPAGKLCFRYKNSSKSYSTFHKNAEWIFILAAMCGI